MKVSELFEDKLDLSFSSKEEGNAILKKTFLHEPLHILAFYASPFSMDGVTETRFKSFFRKYVGRKIVDVDSIEFDLKDTRALQAFILDADEFFNDPDFTGEDEPWPYNFQIAGD